LKILTKFCINFFGSTELSAISKALNPIFLNANDSSLMLFGVNCDRFFTYNFKHEVIEEIFLIMVSSVNKLKLILYVESISFI